MRRVTRLGKCTFFFLSLFCLPSSFIWAHSVDGSYSHIDAYYLTGSFTGLGLCSIYNDASSGWDEADPNADDIPLPDVSDPDLASINNTLPDLPRNIVRFVVRHGQWVGVPASQGAGCAITDVTFDIKRVVFKQNAIQRETVRSMTFPNLSISSTACPSYICIDWDGSFAVDDKGYGKMNGPYEASAKLVYKSTEITLDVTLNYPGEGQAPITVDVMDIHSVVSSPTVVGVSRVASFPVNISYKLSKSAYVTIDIYRDYADDSCQALDHTTHQVDVVAGCLSRRVRRLVDNQSRWGEDTTQGQQGNFEAWDGKDTNGALVSSGTYVMNIFAWDPNSGVEPHGILHDRTETQRSISLDPFQIVDLTMQPLTTQSTSYAGIGFMLTEAATVYFDIWRTSAVFANINVPPSFTSAIPTGCADYACPAMKIRHYQNNFPGKTPSSIVWDGRDSNGNPMDDGNYVFSIWAAEGEPAATARTTARYQVGVIPVTRGFVGISQIQPVTTAFSSPAVSGIAPYSFNYSLERDALVALRVLATQNQFVNTMATDTTKGFNNGICTRTQGCPVITLVNNETRPGRILISDPPTGGWDGRSDTAFRISSGVYLIELQAIDTLFPNRVSSITALFPVDLLRVANVATTPLLQGSTDVATISYALSETMDVSWKIYPATTTLTGTWPSLTASTLPVRTIFGPRPGRVRVTESWDGRNEGGLFVNDANYISVLTARDAYGNYATDPVIKEIPVSRGQILIVSPQVIPTFPTTENSSSTLNIPLEPFEIQYALSRDAIVDVSLRTQEGVFVSTLVNSEPRSGFITNREFWDGTTFAGVRLTTANLFIDIFAEDSASLSASFSVVRLPLSIDLLRVYDVAVTPLLPDSEFAEISYQLSEAMNVDIRIYKPGTQFNIAGEPYPQESESLVFRIHGPRPGRTAITESWEGINLYQKQLPDGNYVFRMTARDERGNLSTDIVTGNLNVLRLGFIDVQSTFDEQTFAYPNPATKTPVKICTLVPIDSNLNLKIYNLSGDLVWERALGFRQGGTSLCGTSAIDWNLESSWGKRVARGVYFYVLRADSVGGEKQFLQTRKKLLIP